MKRKVTVIEAIEHARQRIRVAAYVRVSSKSEDQENSFQAQQLHYQSVLAFDPKVIRNSCRIARRFISTLYGLLHRII